MTTQETQLTHVARTLERIAEALERLAPSPVAPGYQFPLESWNSFDWRSIGAVIEQSDTHGPTVIRWHGLQFLRRAPANRYSEALWFSRCTGKDDQGENQYERLITFKPVSKLVVDPVPERVARLMR